MRTRTGKLCALATMVLGIGLTGCFGESIVSAGAKVASGQISQLTSGEIKILNQTVTDVLASTNPGFTAEPLTDAQAEALSSFLKSNNLNTIEDFEALKTTAETNPESLQGLDELAAAFNNGQDYQGQDFDLDAIFNALFGASGGTGTVGTGTGTGTNTNTNVK